MSTSMPAVGRNPAECAALRRFTPAASAADVSGAWLSVAGKATVLFVCGAVPWAIILWLCGAI
jgi:hypothetical protein